MALCIRHPNLNHPSILQSDRHLLIRRERSLTGDQPVLLSDIDRLCLFFRSLIGNDSRNLLDLYEFLIRKCHTGDVEDVHQLAVLCPVNCNMELLNQFGKENLCVTRNTVVLSVQMEVYGKCICRHSVRLESDPVHIAEGYICRHRLHVYVSRADIRGICRCRRPFLYGIDERKVMHLDSFRGCSAESVRQLRVLHYDGHMNGTSFRLILHCAGIAFFVGFVSDKRDVIKQSIVFVVLRIAGCIQCTHVGIIIIFTASRCDARHFQFGIIRNRSRVGQPCDYGHIAVHKRVGRSFGRLLRFFRRFFYGFRR